MPFFRNVLENWLTHSHYRLPLILSFSDYMRYSLDSSYAYSLCDKACVKLSLMPILFLSSSSFPALLSELPTPSFYAFPFSLRFCDEISHSSMSHITCLFYLNVRELDIGVTVSSFGTWFLSLAWVCEMKRHLNWNSMWTWHLNHIINTLLICLRIGET